MQSNGSITHACKRHEINDNDTHQSSTALYAFDFLYISKDLTFRIEAQLDRSFRRMVVLSKIR